MLSATWDAQHNPASVPVHPESPQSGFYDGQMRRRTLLLFLIGSIPSLAPGAGDAALDRATLRGLTAVNVVVDKLDAQIEGAGVTASAVRARLEDRLRAANITIDESKPEFMAVRMTGVRANRGPFAVAVTLGAYQPVTLSRDPKIKTATQTWEVETVLLAEPKQLYRATMDTIDELAGAFVTAYRSVNSGSAP